MIQFQEGNQKKAEYVTLENITYLKDGPGKLQKGKKAGIHVADPTQVKQLIVGNVIEHQ